ncbi:MAG: DUF2243 domain-containing protein [Celeribacter sp.]|jgi:uncharacterized membrane protein
MLKATWLKYALLLGIALGGFFDGILLHQILQWHHLLSLVPAVTDLRMQVLWDGYFHLLMYVFAMVGLWGLWRAWRRQEKIAGRSLVGALTAGFGIWHMLDGVLSHWLLGIHRIKIDSEMPLLWDIGWFLLFGLLPALVGWSLLHRDGGGGPALRRNTAPLVGLSLLSVGSGVWALQPPADNPFTTVVFRAASEPGQVDEALSAVQARVVWSTPDMGVVVVDMPSMQRWNLYQHGALLVGGTGVPAGCFNWSTAEV